MSRRLAIARFTVSAFVCAWCLSPQVASAQVVRCTDPGTGHVTYTDGDCASGQARKDIAPPQTPQEIAHERAQAEEALRAKRERQQAEAQRDREARDSEAPQHAPVVRRDPALSSECGQAREALQQALARDPTLYDTGARMDAAQREADFACLTPSEFARVQADRERQPAYPMAGYAPPIVVLPRPPGPPHHRPQVKPRPEMVQCNVFRCYDKQGRVYPR